MRRARVAALLTGLAAALSLSACGVPTSGVIEAGEPASGVSSPTPRAAAPGPVTVYFLRDGRPAPYLRRAADSGNLTVVVGTLFRGPTAEEAPSATTQLPHLQAVPEVDLDGDGAVTVHLPRGVPALSHLAMLQLACTVGRVPSPTPRLAQPSGPGTVTAPAQHLLMYQAVRAIGEGWTMTQSATSCASPGQPPSP